MTAAPARPLASGSPAVPRPLRVLHIHSGNLRGGIEGYLVSLVRYAALAPSMTSDFALGFEGWLSRELRAAGAGVSILGPVRVRHPATVLAARQALSRLLATERYDVVVTHSAWSHALFAPTARARRVRVAHRMHDVPNPRGWLDWWANGTFPDVVLCNSEFTQGCGRWLFPTVPRHVVYAPLDPAEAAAPAARDAMRAALGAKPDDVVVLQASRLESWKGHPLLLASLAELRDDPRWTCWIAGGPQRPKEHAYFESLKEQVRRSGLADRVRFLGQRDDVPALMRAADIHCQANIGPEPFGQVFIEALAAGLPVVTTDMGGGREIVTDACGVRVAPEPRAVAAGLERLIADPALRATLARAAPGRAREMGDPEVRMGELEAVLARVVRDAQSSPGRPAWIARSLRHRPWSLDARRRGGGHEGLGLGRRA